MVPVESLNGDAAAVGKPVDASQVAVVFRVGDQPSGGAGAEFEHAHLDARIGLAGFGVTLRRDLGVLLGEVHERVLTDRSLVEPVVGDTRSVRAPPVPDLLPAPNLLPIHPVGFAVERQTLATITSQSDLVGALQVVDPEVVAANECDSVALGGELRVFFRRLCVRELTHTFGAQVKERQVSVGFEQDALVVRRPVKRVQLAEVIVLLADLKSGLAALGIPDPEPFAVTIVEQETELIAVRRPLEVGGSLARRVVSEELIEIEWRSVRFPERLLRASEHEQGHEQHKRHEKPEGTHHILP